MASPTVSLDESSVRFIKEVPADQDLSEATSRRTVPDPSIFQSSRRRSLREAAVVACLLVDEEDVMDEEEEVGEEADETHEGDEGGDEDGEMDLEEEEGEGSSPGEEEREAPRSTVGWDSCNLRSSDVDSLILDFHIPSSFVIYTPVPTSRPPFLPDNCLSFFVAQMRLGLRFPILDFYFYVVRFYQVPLNQLVPNSFRILASFFIIFCFRCFPVTAKVFAQCFHLKKAELEFFLFTPRPSVSFLPAPIAPKN